MTRLRILLLAGLLLLGIESLDAQPPPPPGSNNPAPLGFVEILLGAGAIYGARQVARKKNPS